MRAAALDLRGHGDSTLGPCQSTLDDYCAGILRVAEKLGAKRLVQSYGSWMATSFAIRRPNMRAPPAEIRGVAGRIRDAAAHPDVRFEVIADAGHVCNVEQPDAYNRLLFDLLGRLT